MIVVRFRMMVIDERRTQALAVTHARRDADHLRLMIRDNGHGGDPDAMRGSMGSKLIVAFVDRMRGEKAVEAGNGHCATVTFPLQDELPGEG